MNTVKKCQVKYIAGWENGRPWLRAGDNPYNEKCTVCEKQLMVGNGGLHQVITHARSRLHIIAVQNQNGNDEQNQEE